MDDEDGASAATAPPHDPTALAPPPPTPPELAYLPTLPAISTPLGALALSLIHI